MARLIWRHSPEPCSNKAEGQGKNDEDPMRIRLTATARSSYDAAPDSVRFDKNAVLLAESLRHPSLRAKKYDESYHVWQARINNNWRFYLQIVGDTYSITK